MEDTTAITPSEAARILSQSRWDDTADAREQAPPEQPQSEGGEYYGKEATERRLGYEPMRVADPVNREPDAPIERSELRPDQEAPVSEPTPVQYQEMGGERQGQPKPANETVSAEQAAHDLSRWRESLGENIEALEAQQIRDAIDQLRAGDAEQQQPEPIALDQRVQPQPEAQTPPVAEDPVAKALSDPAVLNAVQQEVGRYAAQADQVAQHYIQVTAVNANSAYANLIASFPEIQNVRPDELGTALQVLAQSDPQKAQAITRHIETVSKLTQEANAAANAHYQAQAAEAQRNFQRQAGVSDGEFSAWAATQDSPERVKEISTYAQQMLRETMTDADIAYHWHTNPLFRSSAAQRILYQVAKYEMSLHGGATKK
jgi:hypothetical protein